MRGASQRPSSLPEDLFSLHAGLLDVKGDGEHGVRSDTELSIRSFTISFREMQVSPSAMQAFLCGPEAPTKVEAIWWQCWWLAWVRTQLDLNTFGFGFWNLPQFGSGSKSFHIVTSSIMKKPEKKHLWKTCIQKYCHRVLTWWIFVCRSLFLDFNCVDPNPDPYLHYTVDPDPKSCWIRIQFVSGSTTVDHAGDLDGRQEFILCQNCRKKHENELFSHKIVFL